MDKLELAIMDLLTFPETFKSIVDECAIPSTSFVIADVLKKLIHDELVAPFRVDEDGNPRRSLGYDSDRMSDFMYQLTSKGFRILEQMHRP